MLQQFLPALRMMIFLMVLTGFIYPEIVTGLCRPSAAGTEGYDATASGGSNLGPTNPKLLERLQAGAARFREKNPEYKGPIPSDAITASGSGLDPEISAANAMAQASRVAKARGMHTAAVVSLIHQATRGRIAELLGEPRVNVLEVNLQLDGLTRGVHH